MIIKKKNKPLSIKQFFERRNKVLIKRRVGGFGDVLMQRMMFEDFSSTGLDVYYTCPEPFIEMARDHEYLAEEPIELSRVNEEDFGVVYDISTICAITESRKLEKNKDHRSDIWARYCGVELTKHEMHLKIDQESFNFCKETIKKINVENKPVVLLCTKASDNLMGEAKGLTEQQTIDIVDYVRKKNLFPITTDEKEQKIYNLLNVPQFTPITSKTWLALVYSSDLVISVDTATFHMAGGLKKPLVGIFSVTDGKVYGKYYDFVLVQKHRDNGDWSCGPCFAFSHCIKDRVNKKKPCITELREREINKGIDEAIERWKLSSQ